jgi:hypothetical protein
MAIQSNPVYVRAYLCRGQAHHIIKDVSTPLGKLSLTIKNTSWNLADKTMLNDCLVKCLFFTLSLNGLIWTIRVQYIWSL